MGNKAQLQLDMLRTAAIALVVIGITVTIGANIVSNMSSDYGNTSYEYNVTTETLDSLEELSEWFDTIALVIAAAVILGVIGLFIAKR